SSPPGARLACLAGPPGEIATAPAPGELAFLHAARARLAAGDRRAGRVVARVVLDPPVAEVDGRVDGRRRAALARAVGGDRREREQNRAGARAAMDVAGVRRARRHAAQCD